MYMLVKVAVNVDRLPEWLVITFKLLLTPAHPPPKLFGCSDPAVKSQ